MDQATLELLIYGGGGATFALVLLFVMLRAPKQGVRVLSRESKITWVLQKAKIIHLVGPPRDQLVIGKDRYDLPEGIKPALIKFAPRAAKYHKFYVEENGQLLGMPDDLQENKPFPPLMRPKDIGEEGERKSLSWLNKITTDKSSLTQLIIGAIMGIGLGYMLFTNYHPGLVQAPPVGYQYIVQHINSTATAIVHS